MDTIINKLYAINKGGTLSPNQCQQVNAELFHLKVEDIPLDQRDNVKDYISSVLNHNSVEPQLISKLDELLSDLQEIA